MRNTLRSCATVPISHFEGIEHSDTCFNINHPRGRLPSMHIKTAFIVQFGKLQDDVYEVALSFVIEQAVMALKKWETETNLAIVIERRGKKEDKRLDDHFQRLLGKGTGKVSAKEIAAYEPTFTFRNKDENINGLQLADLVAYPIARYVIEPNRANPAFEVLEPKIYCADGALEGLKLFP